VTVVLRCCYLVVSGGTGAIRWTICIDQLINKTGDLLFRSL
jgi:hypothetical protein